MQGAWGGAAAVGGADAGHGRASASALFLARPNDYCGMRMLPYAHVCSRMLYMLTYADACSRMLTYALLQAAEYLPAIREICAAEA